MTKVIIINWRWKNLPIQFVDMEVRDKDDCKCYFVDFNKNNITDFLNQLKLIKADSKLLLLHKSDENGILKKDIADFEGFIDEFEGGLGNVYKREDNGKKGIIDSDFDYRVHVDNFYKNKIIPWENFDFVWESYCEVKPIEDQKKKLINLWLPLAIDIQGLSEVQNNAEKAKSYFEEIKKETEYLKSLKFFPKDDEFPRWGEIEQALKNNEKTKHYADFNPASLVNEILKDSSTFKLIKKNTAKYLEKEIESKPNPQFLPNWLQEVVGVIDRKIKSK